MLEELSQQVVRHESTLETTKIWREGSKFSFFDSRVRQNLVDMGDRKEENGMPYAASPGFSEDYLPAACQ
jgi:hypothetical protein